MAGTTKRRSSAGRPLDDEGVKTRLRARLLGDFALLAPGEDRDETPWDRYDTTSQVLKFLLLQPRLRCHPSTIVDALWSDVDADKALERLSFHVKRLRALLQPRVADVKGPRLISLDRSTVGVDPVVFEHVDAREFSTAAAHALESDDVSAARAALALYRGDLLPYDVDWSWTLAPRRELAERRQALLDHAARLAHAAGDVQTGIRLLTELLSRDSCDERAARLLMEWYHAEGERAEAARVYHTLRARLQEELHVLPGARTEELYASIRRASSKGVASARAIAPESQSQRRRRPRPTELGKLLGREEELAYVDLLMGMVRQRGGAYALFIHGEAGTGKTHLAHEILNRARQLGYHVLAGFTRAGGGAPYAPLIDALRSHAANSRKDVVRAVLASAPAVATLLPDVAADLGLAPAATVTDDLLRHDLVHVTTALSTRRPTVLLLDDVHDADTATLAWLGDLMLAGSAAGLLVVATLRAESAAAPAVAAVMEECRRRGSGESLALYGLNEATTTDYLTSLLGRPPTPELAHEIHAKTAGNPFLMAEIARELRAHGSLEPRGPAWGLPRGQRGLPVPESVRGLARARLAALDGEARRLVALASVTGAQPVTVLARLGGWPVDRVLDLLDELVAAGIFEEREGYHFRHEMLREAVYEAQGVERRTLLHATVAAGLEQDVVSGAHGAPDIAELTRHYLLGGPAVAQKAVHFATLAGDRAAAVFAHGEATTYYQAALERAPTEQRALLYERIGASLTALGEYARAGEALTAALSLGVAGWRRAMVLWRLAATRIEMGAHADAARHLAEAEVVVRGSPAGDDMEPHDQALLRGRIFGARARLALDTGDLDAAQDLAAQALALLEPLPHATLERLEVRNAIAGALYHRGQLDDAQRYLEAQLPDAHALGHPAMLCRLHANRGLILQLKGDLAAAMDANDTATAALGSYHDAYRSAHLIYDRGTMQIDAGRWDEAVATMHLVLEDAERNGWLHLSTRARVEVARPLMAREQLTEAMDHVERSLAVATRPGFNDESPVVEALVRRAAVHRRRGDFAGANADLVRALSAATRVELPSYLCEVRLGLSALSMRLDDTAAAEEHARVALAIALAHGFRLYRARAGVALACSLVARSADEARAVVDDAVSELRACGAVPYLVAALELQTTLRSSASDAGQARDEAQALRKRLGMTPSGEIDC